MGRGRLAQWAGLPHFPVPAGGSVSSGGSTTLSGTDCANSKLPAINRDQREDQVPQIHRGDRLVHPHVDPISGLWRIRKKP
jgi:hypothetical protein